MTWSGRIAATCIAALGLGSEAQLRAVRGSDRAEVGGKSHRRNLAGLAGHPHGALGADGRIVDS